MTSNMIMRLVGFFGEFVAPIYQQYRGFHPNMTKLPPPLPAILAKWLFHFRNHLFDLAQAGGCRFQALFQLFNLRFQLCYLAFRQG